MASESSAAVTTPIYLDYCATTPVDRRVLEKMLPFFTDTFGNAASRDHAFGWDAHEAVETARSAVAELVSAHPADIIFTGSATESINMAIQGTAMALRSSGNHIVTTAVEHHAVLATCSHLEKKGFEVTRLPVDGSGNLDLTQLENALRPSTILLAVMHANNETGVLFPIDEIATIARKHGVRFFTDATQSAGKIPVDFNSRWVDCAAFSAHKFYGPKGIGALYLRNETIRKTLPPVIFGGGQESGLRSGTHNVPAIVGFGEACRIAREEMQNNAEHCRELRDTLEGQLTSRMNGITINGSSAPRLPHVSSVSFDSIDTRAFIRKIGSLAVSTASACSSGISGTSQVLAAMGKPQKDIEGTIRISLGRYTTREEIDRTVELLIGNIHERECSPGIRLRADRVYHNMVTDPR